MSDKTKIAWTDASWNPTRGCSRISPGCEHCYAERMAARFSGPGLWGEGFADSSTGVWTRKVALIPSALDIPLHWRRPRRIFVDSTSDLFHEGLSNEDIAAVFGVMAACPQHVFQTLTKRASRMAEWFRWAATPIGVYRLLRNAATERGVALDRGLVNDDRIRPWPLPNVWIGVSVEDQERAIERVQHLRAVPAAVRFLSSEPLLEWIDLGLDLPTLGSLGGIGWVIVGGESGPGARPMRVEWARSIVEQCRGAGVPVFVKQLSGSGGHAISDFNEIRRIAPDLAVRQFPEVSK